MSLSAPDWLTRRGGALELGSDRQTWYVVFDKRPHYKLNASPAKGKHVCVIRQTENGRRIDSPGLHESAESALRAGLDDLGKALGWR